MVNSPRSKPSAVTWLLVDAFVSSDKPNIPDKKEKKKEEKKALCQTDL